MICCSEDCKTGLYSSVNRLCDGGFCSNWVKIYEGSGRPSPHGSMPVTTSLNIAHLLGIAHAANHGSRGTGRVEVNA